MRRLGVLGWPVAHSRSPAMFNAAFADLGMEGWRYQRLPVPQELFAETARALGGAGFLGANVTIPHKQAALALAGEASEAAKAIGAANTLTFAPDGDRRGEHRRPRADRGDGAADRDARPPERAGAGRWGKRARGGLGAARGRRGEVSVWNRTPERAEALARDLGVRPSGSRRPPSCSSTALRWASRRTLGH